MQLMRSSLTRGVTYPQSSKQAVELSGTRDKCAHRLNIGLTDPLS